MNKNFFQNLVDRFIFKRPKCIAIVNSSMPFVSSVINSYEDTDENENIQFNLISEDGKFQLSILARVLKISRYKPFFIEKDLENPIITK